MWVDKVASFWEKSRLLDCLVGLLGGEPLVIGKVHIVVTISRLELMAASTVTTVTVISHFP